ncbi:MAG TPA: hypothetical protein VNL73_02535, partial [Verrucomicrobiae bacterium]|nr:hypothetical protein [Verrucomicrobiae bacterium]
MADTVHLPLSNLVGIPVLPNLEQCTHKTGRFWLTVSNYGILGNRKDVLLRDCLTDGFTSSAEFPGGTNIEYLFQGALWVGGIVGDDTLTSLGNDGWVNIREFFPDEGVKGSIVKRSARNTSPFYSPDAISDLDLIAEYYDTLRDPQLVRIVDPETGEPNKSLELKIEQRSYSWAADWGQDWVLLDYTITNMGVEPIRKAYVGLFMDPDVGKTTDGKVTYDDDYCAFVTEGIYGPPGGFWFLPGVGFFDPGVCPETLYMAYTFDNDGDPESGDDFGLSTRNPTGALGIRFLRAGEALRSSFTFPARISFNWWIPDEFGFMDWGPQKIPGFKNIYGGRGHPIGDAMRYYYLSNREIDYDQIASAFSNPARVDSLFAGFWMPPLQIPAYAFDIADGADCRFLLSAGPFDLDPGASLPVTLAIFVGPRFHPYAGHFAETFRTTGDFLDSARIGMFRRNLRKEGLIGNAQMARKVFDNESIRSLVFCKLHPTGVVINDSARFHGDGIPDYKGPAPPPFPRMQFFADEGEVTIRWFGRETEEAIDPITNQQDFEGYTIQMSPDGINYTTIGYFDRVNWKPYFLNLDLNGDGIRENWEFRWEP